MHIFGTNIDLNRNEAKNFRLENGIAFPSATGSDAGLVFYHSGLSRFYGWDGVQWVELTAPSGVTGITGIQTQDEGVVVSTSVQTLNFVGAGITATDLGSGVTQVQVTATGGGGTSHTVENYVDDYIVAEQKLYQGYDLDGSPVITRTDAFYNVESATGLTDLATDWPNRLSLTYV